MRVWHCIEILFACVYIDIHMCKIAVLHVLRKSDFLQKFKPVFLISFVGPLKVILSGGFGGCCLWMVAFPLDVLKSRIQV